MLLFEGHGIPHPVLGDVLGDATAENARVRAVAHQFAARNGTSVAAEEAKIRTQAAARGVPAHTMASLLLDPKPPAKKTPPKPAPKITKKGDAKVAQLQAALRAAGARDAHAELPIVDGIMGPSTLSALNNLQSAFGRQPLTRAQVLNNIDFAISQVIAKATPTMETPDPPTAVAMPKQGGAVTAPVPLMDIGEFRCAKGICSPIATKTRARVVAFQQLLNAFPKLIVDRFPKGGPVETHSGKIGPETVGAFRVVVLARAARLRVPLESLNLPALTAENLAFQLDEVTAQLKAEREALAKSLVPGGGATDKPVAKIDDMANTAIGNRPFRCWVMALQVQLNRFGQGIVIEGVIGPNTVASVNTVMGLDLDARAVAGSVKSLTELVQKKAREQAVPEPPADAGGDAYSKCEMEITQPATDARLLPLPKAPAARGSSRRTRKAVRAPVAAPAPVATPTVEQPLPQPLNTSPPSIPTPPRSFTVPEEEFTPTSTLPRDESADANFDETIKVDVIEKVAPPVAVPGQPITVPLPVAPSRWPAAAYVGIGVGAAGALAFVGYALGRPKARRA